MGTRGAGDGSAPAQVGQQRGHRGSTRCSPQAETSLQRCPAHGLQLFLQPKPKQQLAWKRLEMKTCHHPHCFVSIQFQARLSRSIAADSVHNRVPKAVVPPQHVVFCSHLSCNAATEQGLTQQPTREPKAETTLGAAGKGQQQYRSPRSQEGRGLCCFPPSMGCPTGQAWNILGKSRGVPLLQGPNLGRCEPGQSTRGG